ncbi:secretin N-terminal domain-containing protein [Candidatus Uabimicrobium sp. HlEnr_7]|uniref:secretin N-terminal domain-containing protein n=1 Tax=Candidatus Uabimicrobium helgolandensis TaxID=3095367 RepID=UPI003556E08A
MKKSFVIILILISVAFSHAQDAKVSMEFSGVNFDVFLKWFANFTNKKIIYGNLSSGLQQKKIHFVSPQPVSEEAVEKICMSILESYGLTLVKVGSGASEVYKLIEASAASSKPIALYSIDDLEKMGDGDYYVSQLIVIKYLKASHIINSIRQAKLFDSKSGSIVEIKGANSIIISDFVPNVKRIVKIIRMLDKPPPVITMAFIKLRYADAAAVSQKINQLLQNRARERSEYNVPETITVIPDNRTNSLTIRGTDADIEEIKKIVSKYDVKIESKRIVARIYYLRHITTDKILPTLREFTNTRLFKESITPGVTASGNNIDISITVNDHTKSLIVVAPMSAHRMINKLIRRIDVRRPQVMIRAIICEFTPTDVLNLGIELMAINDSGGFRPQALTSFGLSSVVDEVGNPVTGDNSNPIAGRAVGPGAGLTAFFAKDKNVPFIIRALRSVSHTEVLDIPQIITDDGEQAEIRVEQEEPVASIDALNSSTTSTSFKEFVSAGTVLKIKPHIIRSKWLKLEIEQNVDAFLGAAPGVGIPPPKSSRSIKTTVTVPNNKTIILGGLNGRREIEAIDKIPILGDIPLLGYLFQNRSKSVTKTNLYIFITPIILNDDFHRLESISRNEYKKMNRLRAKKHRRKRSKK